MQWWNVLFQPIVIDAKDHLLGRLASTTAKTLLQGMLEFAAQSFIMTCNILRIGTLIKWLLKSGLLSVMSYNLTYYE